MSEASSAEVIGLLREVRGRLALLDPDSMGAAERVDLLRAAEELRSALAASQLRAVAGLEPSEVGLATRRSQASARRFVGVAAGLREMPHVAAALTLGETSDHRAYLAVRETAHLSRADRARVDEHLAARHGGIASLGDRGMENAARGAADRVDPAGAVRRRSRAVAARRVSLRPAPDGMSRLCAVLPLTDGVATLATLSQAAGSARATGDERSRGQVMADELVARVTGHAAGMPAHVEVSLVMSGASLLGHDTSAGPEEVHEPATVEGYGPIPADLARQVVREADRVWLRRLFAAPETGCLVAMDSRSRVFRGGLRRLVVLRDQVCRTPWCDAPVRHVDHVVAVSEGGATRAGNAQGLCEACNYAKQTSGIRQVVALGGDVVITTATGHTYVSRPPPLTAGSRAEPRSIAEDPSFVERACRQVLLAPAS